MTKGTGSKLKSIVLLFILPVILVGAWQIAADLGKMNTFLIPSPRMIFNTFVQITLNGRLGKNIAASMQRVVIGFAIGAASGLMLGFVMGLSKTLNKLLTLFVSVLRPIPTIALIPVFILLFGIGEESKYAIIAIGSFWSVLLNTITGVENADTKLLEVAYAYRIPKAQQIFRVVLPSALPSILTGIRLGVSAAWISVIAAEMLAASRGIGYMITYARDNSQISTMYAGVLTIGIIGLIIDRTLIVLQKFYLKRSRGFGD
ncbi:MAG: ABC transporter permease [Acetatifactor sp.]